MTIAEAAELTGLTKRAIARRIERGGLPVRRGQNGRRYVRIRDLADAGLVDLVAGKPPLWRSQQVDPQTVARELVQTLIRQGIELNEVRGQLELLQDELGRHREELRSQIDQARRERKELRSQIEELRRGST